MEHLWEEIRRRLTNSVCELNKLVEEMKLLVDSQHFESVAHSLRSTGAELARLGELGSVYFLSTHPRPKEYKDPNYASLLDQGEFWTVIWDRQTVNIKASKGIRLLSVLVSDPGRQFHVLDLERYERKDNPDDNGYGALASDAGAILDEKAKKSYRARLEDLRDGLEEAQRFNDVFRASKIQEEMTLLTKELARAFGLHGKTRLAISDTERARVRVTLAVKGVIGKILRRNSPIGWHLASSVRTGSFCWYLPVPIVKGKDGFEGSEV